MKSLILLGAVATTALGSNGETPKNDETTGVIVGKIMWEGDRPEPPPPLTIKEKETTGCLHAGDGVDTEDHSLMIADDGGVANVVLTLEAAGCEAEMPSEPILIDQQGCRFTDRVAVIPAGATVRFGNSDEVNHNIHTYARKNDAINKQVAGGSHLEQTLDKAETIEVKCDVHTWMKCYVFVTDAPRWALSSDDGTFKIEGLPAGEYKLDWWHETLGKGKTEKVTVEAGKEAELVHMVSAKKESRGRGRRR